MARLFNEILGKNVEVPDNPKRIISFSPAVTETLFMLGLGKNIVGVSAFCARPEEARKKRKVGSYNSVSFDLLRSLRPDLVFTVTGYQREFALKLSETFPVYPLELPISVSGIVDMIVKVGLVVGAQERGWEIGSKLLRKLAGIKPITRKLKAYVEIDLGGPVSFGAYSYITDALHLLGLSTLYDEVKSEWLAPDISRVQDEKPDVIFYEAKMYSLFDEQKLEILFRKRGWSGLDVVKRKRFFLTPGPLDFLAHHGPSFIIETLPWLADRVRVALVNE
ncbi:MAG: ABC transporter substrate-binding protein [Nitrososphaerota archaeon]|nr:ABC transporter substrate-binding protein [Nitrososphaerota archaeon]